MISQKFVIIILIFLSTLSILIYVSIHTGQRNGSGLTSPASNNPATAVPTSTPPATAGPTPIILDFKNGLSKEVEKLTPEDFSSDFETLKASF